MQILYEKFQSLEHFQFYAFKIEDIQSVLFLLNMITLLFVVLNQCTGFRRY